MRNLIEEAIREHWGERCPDFEPGCPCCRAWAEFDKTEHLRSSLNDAQSVLYEMANLLDDEDFMGELPGLSGKIVGHREKYHKYMVETLAKAGDAIRAALEGK